MPSNQYYMAIVKTVQINESVSWALWKIDESKEVLLETYKPTREEIHEFNQIKVDSRMRESLAARLALKQLLELNDLSTSGLYKDEFGKPHLKNQTTQISVSHTSNFGAAALNLNGPVGIDIEFPRDQIIRIGKKFLHDSEKSWVGGSMSNHTKVWSAKEALYKLHGRTQLIFAEELIVDPPNNEGKCAGSISENGSLEAYQISYDKHGSLLICLAH